MFADMMSYFHQSTQGQQAVNALAQQGWSPDQVSTIMQHAMPAAANAMHRAAGGHPEPAVGLFNIFGGHAASEFFLGAIAGFLRGDGVWGAAKDGAMGMVGGHIAEVVAQRTGMNQQMAGQVAAALTPFIVHFAHERLASHPSVVQQFGPPPGGGGFTPQGGGGFGGGGYKPQGNGW